MSARNSANPSAANHRASWLIAAYLGTDRTRCFIAFQEWYSMLLLNPPRVMTRWQPQCFDSPSRSDDASTNFSTPQAHRAIQKVDRPRRCGSVPVTVQCP